MKSFFNNLFLIALISTLIACSTIKDGFESQRKNSTEEFLVEKKKPLVMPPHYKELPIPKSDDTETESNENEVKLLITGKENKNESIKNTEDVNSTLEDLLLKKIKNN